MMTDEQKKYGVITSSTGNHGIAVSYHSTQLGIPCIVVMPVHTAITKVNKCARHGAKIIQHGSIMAEAKRHAMAIGKEKKMMYINGFDHPHVIEGQGTVGLEIMEQVPSVDAILVPTGGGSLLCGICIAAKHLKPDTEIYVVVKEDWVARGIMHIIEEERLVVEGAGATPIAAIMAGLFPNLKGKKVVCVLSGGNIDPTILARALERGMAAEGRLVKFKVTVSDRPGGMAELCSMMAGVGVTMRDCVPDRAWVKGDVFSVQLKVIAETRGWDHTKELIEQVKKHYKEYYFLEIGERQDKIAGVRRGPCLAPNPVCMQK